jgi:hypothetical protein
VVGVAATAVVVVVVDSVVGVSATAVVDAVVLVVLVVLAVVVVSAALVVSTVATSLAGDVDACACMYSAAVSAIAPAPLIEPAMRRPRRAGWGRRVRLPGDLEPRSMRGTLRSFPPNSLREDGESAPTGP